MEYDPRTRAEVCSSNFEELSYDPHAQGNIFFGRQATGLYGQTPKLTF